VITESRGFTRVDIGRLSKSKGKIGWEARTPGSLLKVCAFRRPWKETQVIMVGFQKSHVFVKPLMGMANVTCAGCACEVRSRGEVPHKECMPHNCSYDGLHATRKTKTITDFAIFFVSAGSAAVGKPAHSDCQCELTITNTRRSDERNRVILRAFVAGPLRLVGKIASKTLFNGNSNVFRGRALASRPEGASISIH